MLKRVRLPLQRFLAPIGSALAARGVSPNTVTVVGTLAVVAAALALYPRGELFWGSLVISIFVCLDMVDGALARAAGRTGRWGAFLDSTMDRIADAAIFGGLTWWFADGGHQPWLAGLSLFCLAAAMLVSYTRARAEGLGLRGDVGIAERTERLIVVLVAMGFGDLGVPYLQAIGLWVLAVATAITVVQRVVAVYHQARTGEPAPSPAQPAAPGETHITEAAEAPPVGGPRPRLFAR
ncbi:MAG: CDP-alcohol phosphatidyltransferase family protein [Acidothermus sp.]|nr:CDP-alcohol phosphatidyltransferase family protein [Acidothermus sp.]MCL6537106.1 CDP-alcohol phosphatidyltransferase family protein [Acidothermus sp.]